MSGDPRARARTNPRAGERRGPANTAPVLAVDIGGTKLAVGLVEFGGRIAAYDRIETPNGPDLDAEVLWRTIEALIDKLLADGGAPVIAGVGVGCGGPM